MRGWTRRSRAWAMVAPSARRRSSLLAGARGAAAAGVGEIGRGGGLGPLLSVGVAAHGEGGAMLPVGRHLDQAIQIGDGVVELVRRSVDPDQRRVGLDLLAVELDGPLEVSDGLGRVTGAQVDAAAPVVRLGVRRIEIDGGVQV